MASARGRSSGGAGGGGRRRKGGGAGGGDEFQRGGARAGNTQASGYQQAGYTDGQEAAYTSGQWRAGGGGGREEVGAEADVPARWDDKDFPTLGGAQAPGRRR